MDPEGLVGAKGEVWGYWGLGRDCALSQKKNDFYLKWHVLLHFERYFLSVYLPEKCRIFRPKW